MRLLRTLFPVSMVTLLALIYVHQQVEMVKLSYRIDSKEKKLNAVLDRTEILHYNIDNLQSSSRLEKVLVSKKVDVSFPKRAQVVRTARAPAIRPAVYAARGRKGKAIDLMRFAELFGSSREAQASQR